MPDRIPYLNVFLSSPGDVPNERAIARKIMKRLPNRYGFKGKVALNIIAWDDPESGTAMEATLTPQEAINRGLPRPSECDIVIVILWSRMGTPFTHTDGQKYLSGTHWELLDALQSASTRTYIYQRTEDPDLGNINNPKYDENVAQYRTLQEFLASDVFYEDGEIKRAIQQYASPSDFEELFELRFEEIVGRILEDLPGDARPAPLASSPNIEVAETVEWAAGKSPFPGLRSFTRDDAAIFFGRERETDTLVKRVAENRFVTVVGASGSGKSSLVGAGLLPRLEANAISDEDTGSKDWYVVQFTPGQGEHPFGALFDGIIRAFDALRPSAFEIRKVRQGFISDMTEDPATVCDTLIAALETAKAPPWAEILLFIDQFEELFTLAKPETVAPFVAMLHELAAHPRVRLIVTMRHDFVHRAVEVPELAELLNLGTFHLPSPTMGALAQMIKRPAELAALEIEDGLPEQILSDMGSDAGALALMAYTLDELYKIADGRHDRRLTFADYEALGGVRGAIGKRAEEVFQKLALEDKEMLLGHVFRELVEVDERGTATRQRAGQGRFGEREMELVRAFTDARLLVMDEVDVEVAHEALFRNWDRLKEWIAETQEDLILLRQVRNAAHDWHKKDRPDFLLWQQERLVIVYAMLERLKPELSEIEQDFIEPEQERLLRELEKLETSHNRRREIGDRLEIIGDVRPGVGVKSGVPDMVWLPVEGSEGVQRFSFGEFRIHPFHISKYLVTHAQYQAFLEAEDGFGNLQWWHDFPKDYQLQSLATEEIGLLNNPRDRVSWYQCVAFGRWLNQKLRGIVLDHSLISPMINPLVIGENVEIRLPLEWEWQWAAQGGVEERVFPWGDWSQGYSNTSEAGLKRTVAVGMYPLGQAKCGALDLAGNLYEWCQNDSDSPHSVIGFGNSNPKIVRGGAFSDSQKYSVVTYRGSYNPYNRRNPGFGFRLVIGTPLTALTQEGST